MRYLNELILKGGVKRVSLLLAISIDSDQMVLFCFVLFCLFVCLFVFFMHANVLAELVLKRVEDMLRMSFTLKIFLLG